MSANSGARNQKKGSRRPTSKSFFANRISVVLGWLSDLLSSGEGTPWLDSDFVKESDKAKKDKETSTYGRD
jgi:hypothetical protein